MTRSITMNTKMLLWGFAEGGDRLCTSCWGPEAGFLQQWSGTPSGTTHIPRQDSPLPLKAACGFNLITPLLIRLSVLEWLLIQILSSLSCDSRPTFPIKPTSLTKPQELTHVWFPMALTQNTAHQRTGIGCPQHPPVVKYRPCFSDDCLARHTLYLHAKYP